MGGNGYYRGDVGLVRWLASTSRFHLLPRLADWPRTVSWSKRCSGKIHGRCVPGVWLDWRSLANEYSWMIHFIAWHGVLRLLVTCRRRRPHFHSKKILAKWKSGSLPKDKSLSLKCNHNAPLRLLQPVVRLELVPALVQCAEHQPGNQLHLCVCVSWNLEQVSGPGCIPKPPNGQGQKSPYQDASSQ